jgi:hypothetical protein
VGPSNVDRSTLGGGFGGAACPQARGLEGADLRRPFICLLQRYGDVCVRLACARSFEERWTALQGFRGFELLRLTETF